MASIDSTDNILFEETQISPTVTANEAVTTFRQHGIFYQANVEIGKISASLGSFSDLKETCSKIPRLHALLEAYGHHEPTPPLYLAASKGDFFTFTTSTDIHDRAFILMWDAGTQLEFSHTSLLHSFVGRNHSNGMVHIPYSQLQKQGCIDVKIHMEQGGLMMVHPRLAFQVIDGFAKGWGCRAGQGD